MANSNQINCHYSILHDCGDVEEEKEFKDGFKKILKKKTTIPRSYSEDVGSHDTHADQYVKETIEDEPLTANIPAHLLPSSIEDPKHVVFGGEDKDSSLRKNHTISGALEEIASHKDELYPHFHHVMSRHRPKTGSQDRKKHRKISETATLPTIPDEHHQEHPEPNKDAETESELEDDTEPPKKSFFTVGDSETEEEPHHRQDSFHKKHKRKHKPHSKKKSSHSHFTEDELKSRRAKGSEVAMYETYPDLDHMDDDEDLDVKDLEDMSHHRFDDVHAKKMVRGKKSHADMKISGPGTKKSAKEKLTDTMYKDAGDEHDAPHHELDHTPHDLFVEMAELIDVEWIQQSRWIKYEEARQEGSERWGKPHVSSLSFHSLINLRIQLERAVMLLDLEAKDMNQTLYALVEELNHAGLLEDELKGEVLRILLYKHKHVHGESHATIASQLASLRRNYSRDSMSSFKRSNSSKKIIGDVEMGNGNTFTADKITNALFSSAITTAATGHFSDHEVPMQPSLLKHKYPIMGRLPDNSEGALTLCAAIESLQKPIMAFVRLAESKIFSNALEIPLPLRFVFMILTPKPSPNIDCHEVGRAFSTLMSNKYFHDICYSFESRDDLLNAINDFLDESIVLPPGDWASKNLLSVQEIQEMRQKKKKMKEGKENLEKEKEDISDEKMDAEKDPKKIVEKPDEKEQGYDPMRRAPYMFGGVIRDWKKRFPLKVYWSDIKDGLDGQVFAAAIFIFFACLSGAIAFGGILGETTSNRIGITETIIVSSVSGILWALFAGCPLIITGVTGPVLLFDQALFDFSKNQSIDFLAWRVWIGIWLLILSLIVAAFQGSILVKFFTKFTKDIFASLIALLFIVTAFEKLGAEFKAHPLQSIEAHCDALSTAWLFNEDFNQNSINKSYVDDWFRNTSKNYEMNVTLQGDQMKFRENPNTALLSAFLMLGTFIIAYYLRIFRNGHFLGRTVRRALGDFGVPIAILIMFLIDYFIKDTYTQKLNVPDGFELTSPEIRNSSGGHGWFINPFPDYETYGNFFWYIPLISVVPAILLFVLLFMETHICELLMMDRTMCAPNFKGTGVHWDIVLLCAINCLGSLIGGPWICAATVRAVSHVSALTVMSTNNAPGEPPKIVGVKDQRMSFLFVSVVLGFTVFLSSFLKLVPFPVLYGVFLYMGVSSIGGIQFIDRLFLLLMPVKHHPSVSYIRRVRTWKMHFFTIVQFCGLALLWGVKSWKAIALAFPFFVLLMVPLRMTLPFLPWIFKFTQAELEALDGKEAGKFVRDEEPDFYEQALGA